LRRQAQELGIASQVMFLGVRNDIAALLSAADALVLSSAWEGMPNVIMEALAAGKPVVATQVGGVAELVEAGRSGFLAPAGDAGALSRAMGELMSMTGAQRRQMGLHGRDHIAAHYSLPVMVDRWSALYRELMTQKGLSPR
jgi:glycosyltransferase involved in cell wall biosynthesis